MSGVTWPMMKLFIQLEEAVGCQLKSFATWQHHKTRTSQSNTIRALRDRPDLSNDNPSAGTPAVTEVDDEQPDHDNGSPASTFVGRPLVFVLGKDDCDDDVAGGHPDGAGDENRLAADFVYVGDSWHGCEPHDDADDATC
jgi:hypothetical protein